MHDDYQPIDVRNMTIKQITNNVFNNPQKHFRQGNCNDCGYPGHWQYACKLLDITWKKKFTRRANQLAKRTINVTQE